jgi:hypothetical protein
MAKRPLLKSTENAHRPPSPRSRVVKTAPRVKPRSRRAVPDDTVVTIRTQLRGGLIEQRVSRRAPIARLAEEWTYILRSRTRWADDRELRHSARDRALRALEFVGVPRTFMKKLATASHVEVELHDWDPADADRNRIHEAAAEVPWEYLLSSATRGVGRYLPQLITRLFRNGAAAIVPAPPRNVLFIESAPGRLEGAYDFDSERDRIRAAVGADGTQPGDGEQPARQMTISATQNLGQLKKTVRRAPWDVLHVTGIDTHQAAWFIDTLYDADGELATKPSIWNAIVDSSGRIRDGMILRESNVPELPVNYDELATALINPKSPPWLVTLNLYYSGARTAREIVRRGAHAAMGFLDEIDDELAERFFQAFYWAWCRPGGAFAIPHAFIEAWQKMRDDRLHGTAIVIWMGRSVFEEYEVLPRNEMAMVTPPETRRDVLARLDSIPMRELLQVQLEVDDEVNYSLLHNDRTVLNRLTLTKLVKEPLEDIKVTVELNLGAENYPYRYTHLVLDEPQLAVAPMVRIPLTAALPRSLRERVLSTVYVKVTCGKRTASETTKRVTLIPVDEWVDDTNNNPWLPSFVLPRDPAVLKIIGSSRRYLVGIKDDPAAGFDGYQSVDRSAENPTAGVDEQVQAIWTALVNEYRFQYINPPPAYSQQSQRLRTPSDILASNTGTCIDLALLLASCLEYIDIYPVVVLLTGHAFVGYWRSEEAHDAFVEVMHVPAEVPPAGSPLVRLAGVRLVEEFGWRLTRLHYDEIMEYVTSGDLVMLEATYLTSASSFADAVAEGRADMRSRREFDSLLDIRLARSATPPVTPLPIINE